MLKDSWTVLELSFPFLSVTYIHFKLFLRFTLLLLKNLSHYLMSLLSSSSYTIQGNKLLQNKHI